MDCAFQKMWKLRWKRICVCLCCDKCHELSFWLLVCCKFGCIVVSYDWDRLRILQVLNLESVQMNKCTNEAQGNSLLFVVEWTTFNSVDFVAFKEFFGRNVDFLTISTNISSNRERLFVMCFQSRRIWKVRTWRRCLQFCSIDFCTWENEHHFCMLTKLHAEPMRIYNPKDCYCIAVQVDLHKKTFLLCSDAC